MVKRNSNDKVTSYSTGIMAESRAVDFLENKGFDIIETRYKTKFGEVDIIAQKDDILCFIEVKYRPDIYSALEAVSKSSQKRIENSALFFLSENDKYQEYALRFDVIALFDGKNDDYEITHLDNAWEATTIY